MMNEECRESGNLLKLCNIAAKLQKHPVHPDSLLKEYTSIYTQSHNRSEEYFTTLCEHKFINLLLTNSNKIAESTCILQCLNFLLTNTKKHSELTYFFSQNEMHNYLFGPRILEKGADFIQYYVQLMKTILIKISSPEENRLFIRLFCNDKYPTFPMLTYITIIAGDPNELIKVTAQQCILILVNMINENKIYSVHLSEPPMLVFIVRLATQFLKTGTDHQGICKYLADLMYELRRNTIALLLISNIFCNTIIIPSLPYNTENSLSFVSLFSKCIETRVLENEDTIDKKGTEFYEKKRKSELTHRKITYNSQCSDLIIICYTFYRVLVKYMTYKKINAIYLSSFIHHCPTTDKTETILPLRIVYPTPQSQYKILCNYALKQYINQTHSSSQTDLGLTNLDEAQKKLISYCQSKQFAKVQQNYYKQVNKSPNKLTQSVVFFEKLIYDTMSIEYIKHISNIAGVAFVKEQPISHNFTKLLIPCYSTFVYEYNNLKTMLAKTPKHSNLQAGQKNSCNDSNETHYNCIQSQWSFNIVNLDIIYIMAKKYKQFTYSSPFTTNDITVSKIEKPPCFLFLAQFKQYLETSIHEHIENKPKNKQLIHSIKMLITLGKLCSLLDVQPSDTQCKSLVNCLLKIRSKLQDCLSKEGFKDLNEYFKNKNKITLLDQDKKPKKWKATQGKFLNNNNEKRNNVIKMKAKPSQTILLLCCFQLIQKLVSPQIEPLSKHFELKWKQTYSQIPLLDSNYHAQQQILYTSNVSYSNKQNCKMTFIKLQFPATVLLRIQQNTQKLLQLDLIKQNKLITNPVGSPVIQFGEDNSENFIAENNKIAKEIIKKFQQCKDRFGQCIISATLEYLCNANQQLNFKVENSHQKLSQSSTILQ